MERIKELPGGFMASKINEIIRAVNVLMRFGVAAPLAMRQSGSGTVVSLGRGVTPEPVADPSPTALASTHATDDNDDWVYADDGGANGGGFTFQVVTDIQYSTSTHIFAYRKRLVECDQYGRVVSVGAEGDLVTVDTASAACP